MNVGETVVFVQTVGGVDAGKHGRVMGISDDRVMVGCRVREQLAVIPAHTWDVLPTRLWERLLQRKLKQK